MKKVRINSFFAGIGGFDLAFENAGFRTEFQCEIDKFCTSILEYHWPEVPKARDIRALAPDQIPEAEIWCGGFPCQDVSVARGSRVREGLKGKNSGLFFPFMELIENKLPSVLLLENVVGLLSSHNGQDFRIILEQLCGLGYSVAWRIMNSRYYGAPQSRPRVFICAALHDPELPLKALYERSRGTKPNSTRKGFLTGDVCDQSGAQVPRVSYCLAATSGRHTGTDWSRTYIAYKASVRRLTPSECEGLQGFPHDWTNIQVSESPADGDFDSPRYHALGNAVAVPVVTWIAKRIRRSMNDGVRLFNGFTAEEATAPYSDFSHPSARNLKLSDLHYSTQPNGHHLRWQSGGYARRDYCFDIKAPEAPSTTIEKPLIEVIERQHPAKHYYLSSNAAEGILRRVDSQNRMLFGPMDTALRAMVKRANPKSRSKSVN